MTAREILRAARDADRQIEESEERAERMRARYIINEINRAYLDTLIDTTEGYRLKDQALAGDITGATKELAMLKGRARR